MIDEGTKADNNVSWLGAPKTKPYSREVVESKYSRMVKFSKKDGEIQTQYPPFIRATFPTTFKAPYEFTCEIYDKDNNPLSVSLDPNSPNSIQKVIPPGCRCSALLSGSIWCNGTGYGVTWRVAQLKVFPANGALPKGKCLVEDPDDEAESDGENTEEKKDPTPETNTGSETKGDGTGETEKDDDTEGDEGETEGDEGETEVTEELPQPKATTVSSMSSSSAPAPTQASAPAPTPAPVAPTTVPVTPAPVAPATKIAPKKKVNA